MELKTKYQYTYFIYPYLIEKENYTNYLYKLLKRKQCKLKLFDRKKDIQIESYFLPEIKEKMFWSLDLNKQALKDYETMDTKLKANSLSNKECCIFEYNLQEDIPAKIGEEGGIFFDITKMEMICFKTGICFLLMKTVLNQNSSFQDVLNFNYKFRDITSQAAHTKEYENIKIQTQKFQNMQTFAEFLSQIVGLNLQAKQINLDTNRLITYAYTCLKQTSWNETTDVKLLAKEFEKYYNILPAEEQIDDTTLNKENIYQEKYLYCGFSNNSNMLLTSASNIRNYTSLLFQYENEQLYHFIYDLYKKIYLKKLNYEFKKTKNFQNIKNEFLNFVKYHWIYEVTGSQRGVLIEKYYAKVQNLEETFVKLKSEYNLLYKEYEIEKTNKHNKWILALIAVIIIVDLGIIFGKML